MRYQTNPPTQRGWYWLRRRNTIGVKTETILRVFALHVNDADRAALCVRIEGRDVPVTKIQGGVEWAGPIPLPEGGGE